MRRLVILVAALLLLLLTSCADRHSPAGFRLPQGDAERGKTTFVELRCNACHRVAGLELGQPIADPPVPVVLGGDVPHAKTDGDLVTSIINPSHRLAPGHAQELIQKGSRSRMPDYTEIMSVRQMVDLVAFLQSRYNVVRPGAPKQ